MLAEIRDVRQNEGEPFRRWFSSISLDLTIWQDDLKNIVSFQICYDKDIQVKVLTWEKAKGLSHYFVDDGESRPGKYKRASIMNHELPIDKKYIIEKFRSECNNVGKKLTTFVIEHLDHEE